MDLICQQGTVQSGGASVMVRGLCSWGEMGPLIRLETSLTCDSLYGGFLIRELRRRVTVLGTFAAQLGFTVDGLKLPSEIIIEGGVGSTGPVGAGNITSNSSSKIACLEVKTFRNCLICDYTTDANRDYLLILLIKVTSGVIAHVSDVFEVGQIETMSMPKNIWNTKKRKKKRKEKSSDSEQNAEIIERSRMPDPNEPSILIKKISDLSRNNPVKNEVIYPDTRFQRSTTLFPAEGVEEKCLPSETLGETFKRCAEDELISPMPKKGKGSDLPKTIKSTISDDCVIIKKPKKRVKVEVIDLTEDSQPILSVLCSPVKTSYGANRLPGKLNSSFQANGVISIKVESSENPSEINPDTVGSAGMDYHAIQIKAEQNKASESSSEVTTDKSYVDTNKNIKPPVDSPSRIQVKTEKRMPSESVNNSESSIEYSMDNRIQIKAENSMSSENDTEVNLENSHIAVSKDTDSTTCNIRLRSEMDKENEDNRGINVPIKVEQNENCVVGDNSTSLLNFSSDGNRTGIYPSDRPIKSEKNKTNENCEVCETFTPAPRPAAQVKCEAEKMDFLNSYSYEKPQNNEDISQKITNNENTGVVSSETSTTNKLNRMNISPIPDYSIFAGDTRLYERGTFRTPLLKYLKCNTEAEVPEISHVLSFLNNFINNCPTMLLKSHSERSESSQVNDSDSHTTNLNSPMGIENPLEDKFPSTICLSSLDDNERNDTTNNLLVEEKKNNEELFSNEYLLQILSNFKSTEKSDGIADVSCSLKPFVDAVAKSGIIINENLTEVVKQTRLPENKPVQIVNCTTDVNQRNSECFIKNSGNFSKRLLVPPENVKRSHCDTFNPLTMYGDSYEIPPKSLKISNGGGAKKFRL
ncbi:hypothetical protein AVEN_258771-1 [Araneus ventricosus]|uniref:Uncharacterized protein n=1 Tax=Araneus ventricosus TaxID=182803 RepID=A0A4Y2D0D4_ARAVE|nr:hypothetical protein AVEN_258771-1 [Araneus ventricosus]